MKFIWYFAVFILKENSNIKALVYADIVQFLPICIEFLEKTLIFINQFI